MRLIVAAALLAAFGQSPTPALRIVVLEGEGAVNIIQQKTAVRPLVEVRDRNNLPVAGATVTFTVGGGHAAFAGGVQTLTITTNAAGQAAATGFNVLGPGAVQVQVQAAFQGQLATVAIAQTNVATAAAASQAGAASGAAGGGGGGISGTTIAIVGAAVAGGAVAVTQTDLVGGGDSSGKTSEANFSGAMTVSFSNSGGTCVQQRAVTGTLKIVFDDKGDKAQYSVNAPSTATNQNGTCPGGGGLNPAVAGDAAIASRTNPSFTVTKDGLGGTSLLLSATIEFTGTQSGDSITGTLTYTETVSGFATGGGTVSFPLTLR
jgi:hypothetical protein